MGLSQLHHLPHRLRRQAATPRCGGSPGAPPSVHPPARPPHRGGLAVRRWQSMPHRFVRGATALQQTAHRQPPRPSAGTGHWHQAAAQPVRRPQVRHPVRAPQPGCQCPMALTSARARQPAGSARPSAKPSTPRQSQPRPKSTQPTHWLPNEQTCADANGSRDVLTNRRLERGH